MAQPTDVIFEKTFANGWTKKLCQRRSKSHGKSGPLIDPFITSPAGDKLRSSFELLNYVMEHPEYWYNIDVSEINLERVHPDQMKAPCAGTKKLSDFLNYVRSGMSYHEAKERIGGNQIKRQGNRRPLSFANSVDPLSSNSEDSNSSIGGFGYNKTPKRTKFPKIKKQDTKFIDTAPPDESQYMFGDLCQFLNESTDSFNLPDSSFDDSNASFDTIFNDPPEDPLKVESKKEFQAKLKSLMTSIIQYTDEEGRDLAEPFMKLPPRKELPDYYKMIKEPMDISRIWFKIEDGEYNDILELEKDFEILCKNAQKYNEDGSLIYQDSVILQTVFEKAKNELVHDMLGEFSIGLDRDPEIEAMVSYMMIEDVEKSVKPAKKRGRPSKDSKILDNSMTNSEVEIKSEKVEKSEKLFYCEPCMHTTKTRGNMQVHEKSARHKAKVEMANMPHQCDQCGKGFMELSELNSHTHSKSQLQYHRDKQNRKFKCEDCQFAFIKKADLQKHYETKKHIENSRKRNNIQENIPVKQENNQEVFNQEIKEQVIDETYFVPIEVEKMAYYVATSQVDPYFQALASNKIDSLLESFLQLEVKNPPQPLERVIDFSEF